MKGCARAPGAGTILNALANGYGSAFAVDIYTTAEVALQGAGAVSYTHLTLPTIYSV